MKLSDVAIRRPVFTAMLALSLIVLGVLSFGRLGTELFPDVNFPFVSITTVFPGAGPVDVEQQLTKPLEDAVAGISGIRQLRSFSRENVSVVLVQFALSVDLDGVTQEVRERVGAVRRNLPQAIEEPRVARFDMNAQPVLVYTATAQAPLERVRQLAEDHLQAELEQIDGVALVRVEGGRERELRVLLRQEALEALYLPAAAVYEALLRENVNVPTGSMREGPLEISVRADAQLRSAEEARQLVVHRTAAGVPVLLGDIAEVVDGFKEQRLLVRADGREAVSIEVVRRSGANTLAVAEAAKKKMQRILPTMPDGFTARLLVDGSEMVVENAEEMETAIVFGGLMAIAVILLFLLDWRGTLISSLALPTSVIGTFALMYALGFSINIMTLIALSMAIGLLIDDSVVIREAITHRLEAGDDPFTAARRGAAEVGLAVMATTFTICAVFLPVAFMQGMVGQFFRQFGLTIAGAVLLSLFIALTLDPMLSARFSLSRRPGQRRHPLVAALERLHGAVERAYARLLGVSLRHKPLTLLVAVVSFAASGLLAWGLGFEFIPAEDRGQFLVNLNLPAGTSLEETARRSLVAERQLLQLPEIVAVHATVGTNNQPRSVRYRVKTTPRQARRVSLGSIKDATRPVFAAIPQARFAISDLPFIEGTGDWPPIVMEIRGPDLDQLRRHAETIAGVLESIPGLIDVDIKDSPGLPEIALEVDRARAREHGLTASDIAIQSRIALQGEVAGQLLTGSEEDVDVRVSLAEDFRRAPERLGALQIYSAQGPVRLDDVATLQVRSTPAEITREGRQRAISVWAYNEGRALGKCVADIHAALDPIDWGAGYSLVYEGMQKEMADSNEDFALAIVLAFIFIFMVLASQFESLVHPFTIVLALPLAFVGALLALVVIGSPISITANIGLILLLGLSTKNGILLVDGALQRMRTEGLDATRAMLLAGPRRLRPILMTSSAMLLGMLPAVFFEGGGSEFRRPMAVAVLGGVISNTLLTLVIVPVVFVGLDRAGRLGRRLLTRIAPATATSDGPPPPPAT